MSQLKSTSLLVVRFPKIIYNRLCTLENVPYKEMCTQEVSEVECYLTDGKWTGFPYKND